jgi:hypothetical protein
MKIDDLQTPHVFREVSPDQLPRVIRDKSR